MRRAAAVASLVVALACGSKEPTVEIGGESAIGRVSRAEGRIDELLADLDDAVDDGDEEGYEELSDREGRAAVAQLLVARGPALLEATGGTHEATKLAFLAGAIFGAHVEPNVAAPVNGVGLALLRASDQARPKRVRWLFPHVDETPAAPPETLGERALERGLAIQRRGSLVALRTAKLGRCTRSTYLQSFDLSGVLVSDESRPADVRRVWVARLDCLREVGLFLFSERRDGTIRLLGFRFLSDEAYRDALAVLELIGARVEPE